MLRKIINDKHLVVTYIGVLFLVCGCSAHPRNTQVASLPMQSFKKPVYKWVTVAPPPSYIDSIELGMTQGQVRAIMGKPDELPVNTYSGRQYPDKWIYRWERCFPLEAGPNIRIEGSSLTQCEVAFDRTTKRVVGWKKSGAHLNIQKRQCVAGCY